MLCRQPDWRVSVRPAKSALRDYRLPAQPSGESGQAYPSHRRAHESWYSIRHASARSPGHLFFGRATSMLVSTHNCTVDEDLFKVRVARKLGEYRMPYACHRPPCKAFVHAIPRSKIRRQITPWAASTRHPQHGLDKQSIVPCGPARVSELARQQGGDLFVLVITEHQPWHLVLPQSTRCKQIFSKINSPLDDDCQQALGSES